jgi:hypothetical protein
MARVRQSVYNELATAHVHVRHGVGSTAMKQQHFWDVDLVELGKRWIDDMGTFLLTALTFVGLALPVLIPTLILWYLFSINWSMNP